MLRAIRVALTLLMLPGIAASAQEGDPVNWLLNQAVIANDLARIKTLLSVQRSQDELDFALIAAAGRGRRASSWRRGQTRINRLHPLGTHP